MRASALTLRLLDEIFYSPVITVPEAQRRLEVSYPGAKQIVSLLQKLTAENAESAKFSLCIALRTLRPLR